MGRAQQRKISLRRIGRRGGRSNPSQRQKVQKARHGGASDRGAGKTTRTDVRSKKDGWQPAPPRQTEGLNATAPPRKAGRKEPEPDEQQLRPRAHKP